MQPNDPGKGSKKQSKAVLCLFLYLMATNRSAVYEAAVHRNEYPIQRHSNKLITEGFFWKFGGIQGLATIAPSFYDGRNNKLGYTDACPGFGRIGGKILSR